MAMEAQASMAVTLGTSKICIKHVLYLPLAVHSKVVTGGHSPVRFITGEANEICIRNNQAIQA